MAHAAAHLHIGTGFGDTDSPTRAILRLTLTADGTLTASDPVPVTAGENPGWLCTGWQCTGLPGISDPNNPNPNAAVTFVGFEDSPGLLQAYGIDTSGALEPRGAAVSSVGRHPCYLAVDMSGQWLFAANYTEGSVCVCPVLPDGSLGPATDSKKHQGGELIDPALHDRQEAAHCHAIVPHPSNAWVAVCDLGLSTVFIYGFDATRGTLAGAADDPRHLRCEANAGCRHACWDGAGQVLFVNNELDCTVRVAHFDDATGTLTAVQTVAALPEGIAPLRAHHRGGSDIQLHPNGRFLYAGMRSPDPGLIAIFAVGDEGALTLLGHESTRGLVPRNFKLLCRGSMLVVGNQESKTVVSFAIDAASGSLRFLHELSTAPYKPCNISSYSECACLK